LLITKLHQMKKQGIISFIQHIKRHDCYRLCAVTAVILFLGNLQPIKAQQPAEKQYAKSYIFADAADSLLTFGENLLNNFKMQGEGAYERLLEELASAKQFHEYVSPINKL